MLLILGFSVCLFVSNKRQNCWIDRSQILRGASHVHRMIKISKTSLQLNLISIKFRKSTKFFKTFSNFFVFVLQCIQRENVHNRYRTWAPIARKSYENKEQRTSKLAILYCPNIYFLHYLDLKKYIYIFLFIGDGQIDYKEFIALGTQSPLYL